MADPIQTFNAKAPWIMALLMRDFPWGKEDAAAAVGNFGHESGGFTQMQELRPTVPGSRGGWGWPQWTGPRRVAFEAYCKRNNLDPASDEANYKYVFVELKTTERHTIDRVRAAQGLDAKVIAFELAFERAGIKHYPSRQQWARRAIDAHDASIAKHREVPLPGWWLAENEQSELPSPPMQPPRIPEDQPMNNTFQQVLRIFLFSIGGAIFGDAVVEGEMFQMAVGGIINVATFIWWYFWNKTEVR